MIGLEVHAQLKTKTKLFSSAPNRFGGEPNTCTTEVDIGMPGVLPVPNGKAVELAVRLALALGCEVQPVSFFARKHYFYPDLPKGYQISQFEEPYSLGGGVPLELDGVERTVALTRIHMEEDAAKNIHDDAITGGATHVDLNRAGAPLVEIVSEPDIRSPEEAGAYLRSLRSVLRYLDVSDADMEKGQFRCDANVSVRRVGEAKLGTKVELKNLNSFRFVERAIEAEIARQIEVLTDGGAIVQETRGYDDRTNETKSQRTKETSADYRYFPDPDLPPLVLDPAWIEDLRRGLPELPHRKRARYTGELGLSADDARVLTEDREVAAFFEECVRLGADAKTAANWIMRSLLELLAAEGSSVGALALTPAHLVGLLALLEQGRVTAKNARTIFTEMARTGESPEAILTAQGLESVSDTGEIERIAAEIVAANPMQAEQYRAGDAKLLNFFVGHLMKAMRGKADPAAAREVLTRLLGS